MSILEIIKSRRSIRKYTGKEISDESIDNILEGARWAPSGLNNQPWRFAVIRDKSVKHSLSELTHYHRILIESKVAIAVFYNHEDGYNRDKDLMSIGSAIQNMLLMAHEENIGSVWLGEILKNRDKVSEILKIEEGNELVAVIAFGYMDESPVKDRKEISDLILNNTGDKK